MTTSATGRAPVGHTHSERAPAAFMLRLPFRFLRGNYGRVVLTVLALATGVASVCSNSLTGRAVRQAFADAVDTAAGTAGLQVRRGDGGAFSKAVAIDVARLPGIALVVPVLTATAFPSDGGDELLAVHAYDLADAAAGEVYGVGEARRTASGTRAIRPGSVIVTETFAQRHRLTIGHHLDLDTPTGRQSFTVTGLVEANGLARLYGGNLIVMDLFAAQLAFARRGDINRVDLVLRSGADPEQVAARVKAVLPPGMQVESPAGHKTLLEKTTRSVDQLLRVFTIGGLVAAFLIAFSSLSTLFEGRSWEIGILRALGARRRTVWRQLLLEGAVLGVLGVLIGIPMGVAYGHVILPRINEATALVSNRVAPVPQLELHASSLLLAALLGLGSGVAAAALPAWRAAQVQVVETMRTRGVEAADRAARTWGLLRALIAGCAAVTVGLEIVWQSGRWGLIAGPLLIVVTALVARPVVDFVGPAMTRRLGPLLGPFGRLGAAQVARRPRRTALTVAMLAVGVGSVLWLWTLARSFEQSVVALLSESCRADLVVSSSHAGAAFIEAPLEDTLVTRLYDIPGVRAVAAMSDAEVQYEGETIAVQGNDPAYFLNPSFGRYPLVGRHLPSVWESVARGDAVIASSNFVQNMHTGVGDVVTLATPRGPVALQIAGVTNHFLSPRGTLIMSRDVYARMWSDSRIVRAYVLLTAGSDIGVMRAAIAGALGRAYSLRLLSAPEMVEYFVSRVRAAFAAMYVHAFAVWLVVLVGMGETLAAEVAARTRELGTLRTLGARRCHVRRLVVVEAVALAALGLVLATATGLAQGALWVHATFPYLFGFMIELYVPYRDVAILLAATLMVCIVAALWPAHRAAGLQPAVALRHE